MELDKINIYRITHIDNISHILSNGITHKDSSNANTNFVSIGDKSLINNRDSKKVNIDNGNLNSPIEIITLGDFTPFYFGIKMPMLYVIQQGGNFVEKASNPEDIVYIACSIKSIVNADLTYYFSDGHATDMLTSFYNKEKIDLLDKIVDWHAVKSSYWGGQENLNLKRKKQAEFLVKGDVPPNFIIGYGCFNEIAKKRLTEFGVKEKLVKVIPYAYY